LPGPEIAVLNRGMAHFVLIPGANHGGWWYAPLVSALEQAGHTARAITLEGMDPDLPPAPQATLASHVAEVVTVLRESDEPVVLVGHSYGGSVIAQATDAVPDAVRALVFIDAFVPADGDSAWSMTKDWEREWYIDGAGDTGLLVAPLPFFDDRAQPQPIGTLLQRSRLTGAWLQVPSRTYIAAVDESWLEQSPFIETTRRLKDDAGWRVVELPVTHNVLRGGVEPLLSALLDVVD
jgi:pimeloyl-ACP methyl ester carboxylesterase